MELGETTLASLAKAMLLVPLALSALCFAAYFVPGRRRRIRNVLGFLTVAGAAAQLVMSLVMLAAPPRAYPVTFHLAQGSLVQIDFRIDALSLYFILLVNVVALAASWSTWAYLEDAPAGAALQHPAVFHGSINGFHLTMLLVPMLDNLVALWIGMELTTLFSAFLVGHRNTKDAWEAAWKYLVITSAGIILALLGTMFLANAVAGGVSEVLGRSIASTDMNWSEVMRLAQRGLFDLPQRQNLITLSFLFVLVGYGTKAGLAPMHTWLPDGHGEAPAPISALLSGVLLKCALYAVLRFYTITNAVRQDNVTSVVLLGAGLLSLALAVPFILKRNRFKRVLAYHSLEHMGIITFGVGLGGSVAMFGALLHCLNHAVTKALMFLSYGNLARAYGRVFGKEPADSDVTGALQALPKTAVILTLGGLALVGTPPFSVFMSELMILWGGLGSLVPAAAAAPVGGSPAAAPVLPPEFSVLPAPVVAAGIVLFLISTTLIFYGLVRHLARIVLGKPPAAAGAAPRWKEQWSRDIFPLLLPAALMLAFGVWLAPPLADLIGRSTQIVLLGTP